MTAKAPRQPAKQAAPARLELPELFEDEADAGTRTWEETQTVPSRQEAPKPKRRPAKVKRG